MRILVASLAAAAAIVPVHGAAACPPPPPGWVPPTEYEHLKGFVDGASDIVYGIITQTSGQRSRFKVLHVYRGTARNGETIRNRAELGLSRAVLRRDDEHAAAQAGRRLRRRNLPEREPGAELHPDEACADDDRRGLDQVRPRHRLAAAQPLDAVPGI